MTDASKQAARRILWLEDDLNDRDIIARTLAKEGVDCAFTFAEGQRDFETALRQDRFDLVLADYTLPGYDGAEALAAARRLQPGVPLIYVSGHVDEGRVVQSLKAGAVDYVSKDRLQRLVPAIERALREVDERRARRQAEEALSKMQKLQDILLQNIPFGVDIVDRNGQVLFQNELIAELARGTTGQRCWEIYKDNQQRCQDCVMGQALEPGQMVVREHPFVLGGKTYQVNYVGIEYGGKPAALRFFQDITERKQAEEAHARLAAIVTSANDGIYAKTLQGTITSWNAAAERIYGYSAQEMIGCPITRVVPPERLGELQQFNDRIIRGEAIANFETRRLHKNGQPIDVSLTASPIKDGSGKVVGISMIVRDITERKQLEAQLRQSQKMEAIGHLAGGVAHDFNNLLTIIRASTELVLLQPEHLHPSQTECLKQANVAVERAANLTRQLLTFSRKQVMKPQPVDLNELVTNLLKMLRRIIGEQVQVHCDYTKLAPYVHADLGMLEQVLMNLVVNARDAMPEGGKVTITTSRLLVDERHAHPEARAGEFVCLSVADTGTGIAPEHLPHLFEPFFTTKAAGKGTGLGLAVVYGIVKQHQGWVEVTSQAGSGATFKIFLPALAIPLEAKSAHSEAHGTRGGTEKILLVEDDPGVRLLTQRVLEAFGYQVWEAASGRQALQVWQALPATVDLLLTDVVMPDGMTGLELAEQLRQQRPSLKVILMSGYSADLVGKDTESFQAHKQCFLQKPCSTHALLQTVRQCLDENLAAHAAGPATCSTTMPPCPKTHVAPA